LPPNIKKKAIEREKIFLNNPFDSRLDTHKLHGKKKEEWAYSIDHHYRVSFIFIGKDEILYTNTGTHDEVY
jgi:mRNA-degrading endonuclease YafQ of YafQ-DinJ toxin-antitoxin module